MDKLDRYDALLLEDAIDLLCAVSLHLNVLDGRLPDGRSRELSVETQGLLRDALASLRELGEPGDSEDAVAVVRFIA